MGSMSRISGLMGSSSVVVEVELAPLDLCASELVVAWASSRDLDLDGAQARKRSRDVSPRLDKDGPRTGAGRHHMTCAQAAEGMGPVVAHPHQEPHGIDG